MWIAIWQIVYKCVNREILVCAPKDVLMRIISLAGTGRFWQSVGTSVARIFSGLLIGVFLGSVLSLSSLCNVLADALSPLRTVIKVTPVASFIMLAWVWLKRDSIPTFISALMVIPVVWGNLATGIKSVDKKYLELARVYGLKKSKTLKNIYLPSLMPYLSSSVCTSAGLVWKAGIASEVLCQPKNSIGAQLFNAKNLLETVDIFAWTAIVIIISVIIEAFIKYALRRIGNENGSINNNI